MAKNDEFNKLLTQWLKGVRIHVIAHHQAAAFFSKRYQILGGFTTVLSAIVGAGIFATLQESPEALTRLIAGILAITVAVCSAIQTFLGDSERAEKHRHSAIAFSDFRRRLELYLVRVNHGTTENAEEIEVLRMDMAELEETMPIYPQRFHNKALKRVKIGIELSNDSINS